MQRGEILRVKADDPVAVGLEAVIGLSFAELVNLVEGGGGLVDVFGHPILGKGACDLEDMPPPTFRQREKIAFRVRVFVKVE